MLILLLVVLIVSLIEALYVMKKCVDLKKQNAPDSEYKKLINNISPVFTITTAISIIILIISYFVI
ncbi:MULTISPECIES: hypothetical protein [Staphylococcus]|uniref:Mid2-like cell wall stress sensor domain protein n=1 Tax=Staphylococcus hsinchuensis TaxID=3051183 RepID=A0ABZ3E9T8_9STAP